MTYCYKDIPRKASAISYGIHIHYHKKMAEGFAYGRTLLANDVTKIPRIL